MVQRTRREPQRTRSPDGAKLQILNNFGWVPICSEHFQIELIIIIQLAYCYESFNFLVKVKWECVTTYIVQYIPDCTFVTHLPRLVALLDCTSSSSNVSPLDA